VDSLAASSPRCDLADERCDLARGWVDSLAASVAVGACSEGATFALRLLCVCSCGGPTLFLPSPGHTLIPLLLRLARASPSAIGMRLAGEIASPISEIASPSNRDAAGSGAAGWLVDFSLGGGRLGWGATYRHQLGSLTNDEPQGRVRVSLGFVDDNGATARNRKIAQPFEVVV